MDRLFFYFPQNLTGFPQKSQELSTAFNQLSTVFRLLAAFFARFSTKSRNSIHTFEKLSTAFWLFIHILFAPVWCFTGIYPQVNRPFLRHFLFFPQRRPCCPYFLGGSEGFFHCYVVCYPQVWCVYPQLRGGYPQFISMIL